MATAAATVLLALQISKVQGEGTNPSSARAAEGLGRLNGLLRAFFAGASQWRNVRTDVSIDIPYDIPALRVQCVNTSAITITLPDGAWRAVPDMRLNVIDATGAASSHAVTIDRNSSWLIAGAAANATLNTNSFNKLYLFRADLGDWKLVDTLALADPLPTPTEFDDDWAYWLAKRWAAPRYGQTLSQDDAEAADEAERRLRARYARPPVFQHQAGVSNVGWPQGYGQTLSDWTNDR